MAEESNNKKGTGFYFFGKLCAKVGLGLLAYIWLTKTFCKKDDCKSNNGKVTLTINDANMPDYMIEYPYDATTYVLTIPNDVEIVIFDTTKRVSVHNIMPSEGDFENGKELRVGGNWIPYQVTDKDKDEEYVFGKHVYTDMINNNDREYMIMSEQNFVDFMCFHKIWWFNL